MSMLLLAAQSIAPDATVSVDAVGIDVVNVAPDRWRAVGSAVATAGAVLDWLCATHLVNDRARLPGDPVDCDLSVLAAYVHDRQRLHVRTTISPADSLDSLSGLFATADWYEREAAQMLGVLFSGGPRQPLLLPAEFQGYPLRRDFPLTARLRTPWPGAAQGGRRARVPGVNPEWVDD